MTRTRRTGLPALALLASLLVPAAADAERATWDQAHVTQLAQQLAEASEAWLQAVREQPGEAFGSPMGGNELGLTQNAQRLHEQSQALASHLADGKGYDETHGLYQALKQAVDDTEVQARESGLDEPTLSAWSKVADLLRQLAPYYDPKASDEAEAESQG